METYHMVMLFICAISSEGRARDFLDTRINTNSAKGVDVMLSTHYVGKITELAVAKAFLERGYQVSQPLVADSRYDFIVDIKGRLLKIQVKTGTVKEEGAYIEFATSTSHTNTQGTINHSYKQDEIDYFATMLGTQCYVVPVDRCGSRHQRLRLMPTKNGQTKGIMFATEFEIDKVFPTD